MGQRSKKQAKEKITSRASEELYQALFEQAADGIFIADEQGGYVEVNRRGCEMLGYTREELLNLSLQDLIPAGDLARDSLKLDALRANETLLHERRLRCKDGRFLPVEISARMLTDGRFLGIVRDISVRKRTEEQLRESNERFRLLAESSLTGIYLIQENRFRYVNPALAHIFGYSVEEITDKLGPMALVYADDRPLVAENLRRRIEGEEETIHYEFRGLRKDGAVIDIEVHGRRIEYGGQTGVIGTLLDVTERKQTEKALRISEERLQLALDAARMGQWEWSIVTGEVVWSDKCLALYGLPTDTPMSYERFLQALHPEYRERIDAALRRAVEERGSYDELKRTIWPDGSIHWTASRGRVYCDDTGQPIRMIGVSFDITNWKEVENKLRDTAEELQRVMASISDYLWSGEVDEEGNWAYNYYSPVVEKITGRPPAFYLDDPQRWLGIVHPDDRPRVLDAFLNLKSGQSKREEDEYRVIHSDGMIRWVRDSATVTRLESGRLRINGVVSDITGRKQTEEALQKSHEELRVFFSQTIDGCFIMMLDEPVRWDETTEKEAVLDYVFAHQHITKVNDAMLAQYGATREQMLKLTPHDFFQHNLAHGRDLWRRLFDAGKVRLESDERKLDGTPMWVEGEYILLYDAEGRVTGHFGIQRDITERKQLEEELRRSHEAALQFSNQLAVLQEVTNQLSKAESTADLCRQAVQLGRSRLGFDRVSIWFIEEHLGLMRGSFGTDERGQLRDEQNAKIKFRRTGLAWRVFSQKESAALVEHHFLYDHEGQEVGEGDNGMAALWDGDDVIGVISVDNLFTHQPITDRRLEVLRLYATNLGHLITRKRAEEALRASEARFRTLVDHATDAFFLHDEWGTILDVNRQACESLGYSREELVGMTPYDFDASTGDPFMDQMKVKLDAGEMITFDAQHRRKDGTMFPVEVRVRPFWQDGQRFAVSLARDITDRKRTEEALILFRSLLDHANDTIELIDPETGQFLDVNEQACLAHGYTREEYLALTVPEISPLVTTQSWEKTMAELRRSGSRISESQHQRKDGSIFPVETNVNYIRLDRDYVLAVTRDITRRKEAEASLRQREAQLRHIIDTVPEGVLLLGTDGRVLLTNPVAEQFLAVLVPDRRSGRLTHFGQRSLNELLTSPPIGLWHEITSEDRVFEAIARPVENSSHNGGWVLVLRDVTQERDIQQRTQRQERLAAVGQLAAGIAHDFNNILAVIILYAQFISRMVAMPPRERERLHTIEQQARRATELIQQILDFSRQSVLERRPLDLLPFLEKLVTLLERTLPEHIQVELDHIAEAYFIRADPSRIQQVMMNLAVNARDAMPEGGHLQIRLAHVQTEESRPMPVQDLPPGRWVQIAVADSGGGIPPAVLSNIFEPFFTTKEVGEGTGLGLAQVYGIVQQHEGYIDVATEVGKGTTFYLYFPTLNTGENAVDTSDGSALQLGQGQRVLVVEDDRTTRKALLDSLTLMNYEVVEATNGREALTILATSAAEVDLVLSDAVMPEMGGIALFHAMQEQKLTVPIVLLTGHPLSNEMENLQALGLAGWLPKPLDLVNLSYLLAKILPVQLH